MVEHWGWLGVLTQVSDGFIDVSIGPLEALKNGSFGLSHILLFADYAGNGINQGGTFACAVPFAIVCGSCDRAGDFSTMV